MRTNELIQEKDSKPRGRVCGAGTSDINFPIRSDQLFDVIPDALVTVGDDGLIVRVNRKCLELFGYEKGELIGCPVEALMPQRLRKAHSSHRGGYQRHPVVRHMKAGLDLMGLRKDGTEFPVDIMLSPLSSPIQGTIAVIRDISVFEEMNKKVSRLAYWDSLTGLRNRASLYLDIGERLLSSADPDFAIALFDLDKFKEVNDTLGHSAGDELLKLVAERCVQSLPDGIQIYRLGGDEFIVVMPGCSARQCAEVTVTQLLDVMSAPFTFDKRTLFINSSVGVAIAPDDGTSIEELLSNADLALYKAKARGGGCHVLFHDSYRAEAVTRNSLNSRLRMALEQKNFEIFYQPTVTLLDRSIAGAEALLRWHDNGRIIAPSIFIDLLGASPLANKVGKWILREACQTASYFRANGFADFRVAVNLFPSQLADPSFPQEVQQILTESGLAADGLQLEITENIALQENETFLKVMNFLQALGVGLAFDDFGTGFASLSLLTKMPLTHIKLDRSFIAGLPDSTKHGPIVRAMLRMSSELGLCVIAEGIENTDQEVFLRKYGCDEAQGFLYGRPLPFHEFQLLATQFNGLSNREGMRA